jgi:hypothetical protein
MSNPEIKFELSQAVYKKLRDADTQYAWLKRREATLSRRIEDKWARYRSETATGCVWEPDSERLKCNDLKRDRKAIRERMAMLEANACDLIK